MRHVRTQHSERVITGVRRCRTFVVRVTRRWSQHFLHSLPPISTMHISQQASPQRLTRPSSRYGQASIIDGWWRWAFGGWSGHMVGCTISVSFCILAHMRLLYRSWHLLACAITIFQSRDDWEYRACPRIRSSICPGDAPVIVTPQCQERSVCSWDMAVCV